ncbi:MAG: hypothetical protein GXX10_05445 [Clostridiaceae bacterium]|nr:hypothetical protein [Clostridiaceae bacterium]
MGEDRTQALLQDYFIILSKIIRLNDALENIKQELIEIWNETHNGNETNTGDESNTGDQTNTGNEANDENGQNEQPQPAD